MRSVGELTQETKGKTDDLPGKRTFRRSHSKNFTFGWMRGKEFCDVTKGQHTVGSCSRRDTRSFGTYWVGTGVKLDKRGKMVFASSDQRNREKDEAPRNIENENHFSKMAWDVPSLKRVGSPESNLWKMVLHERDGGTGRSGQWERVVMILQSWVSFRHYSRSIQTNEHTKGTWGGRTRGPVGSGTDMCNRVPSVSHC